MEVDLEKFPALKKRKISIELEQKCPVCLEQMMDPEKKTLVKNIMSSAELGAVHEACFLPFMGEKNLRLLFQVRCYSIGDTIAATPVLREVRRIYPKMAFTVATLFPDLFKYNPHTQMILDLNKSFPAEIVENHHFRIDGFDGERASHFAMHSVEFSSICALNRSILPTDWNYELYYHPDDRARAADIFRANGIDPENDKVILVHPHGTEWSTRDWGRHRFGELARRITKKYPDHKMVSIGGKREEVPDKTMKNYVAIPEAVDLYGKFTLLESAAAMDLPAVRLLVTPDTGTLHLGASRPELPIVGIFTLIRAYLRTPVRHGRMGYKFIGVESESGCNCTYNARYLNHETNYYTCPKRDFFKTVDRTNLPKPAKIAALQDFDPSVQWGAEKLGRQLKAEVERHAPEALPCFPSVDRVMAAVDRALEQWGDKEREA